MAVGVGGCDDSSGPTARDLLGLWGAVDYEYTSDADPGTTEDLVNDLGGTYSITLVHDGTYSYQLLLSGTTETGGGTYQIEGNQLILTPTDGTPTTYRFTWDEVFLRLYRDDATYDFGAGPEPASLRILLDRF